MKVEKRYAEHPEDSRLYEMKEGDGLYIGKGTAQIVFALKENVDGGILAYIGKQL